VIDELVAEDSDRRFRETSSCSVNEDAFVDRSPETFVMKVGDVVAEDCVSFDSSSIFESCSWLGVVDSSLLEATVLRLVSEALGACEVVGDIVDLCASSMFRLRNCRAFIILNFSGVAVDASVVTETGLDIAGRLSIGL
jgi:hypothetical protein